jgi:tRNA-binding EMAP/Myf-like protein
MRGLESRGMILVAGSEGRYTLLVPDRDVPEGARLE